MGATTSSFKKLFSFSSSDSGTNEQTDALQRVSPLVLSRKGSMYFDEDGDLAHEFYVEENSSGRKATMKRVKPSCLTPQGVVNHPIPRLRFDYPVVLYED